MAPLIQVQDLCRDYRLVDKREGISGGLLDLLRPRRRLLRAVDQVSFAIEAGEMVGYIGANGAGKSTTIKMLCGLLRPSGGAAQVAGVDVARHPDGVKRRIGYMSQKFSLYGELRVEDNLELYAALYGVSGARYRARRAWAIETAHLEAVLRQKVSELSGGFRQRLALACALLHEPEVVFLDEPTGGVDPLMRRAFFQLIDALAASGVTVFLTTHFLDEAEYCHRVGLIGGGKLVAEGTPTELKGRLGDHVLLEIRTDAPGRALAALAGLPALAESSVFGAGVHALARPGVSEGDAAREVARALEEAGVPATAPARVPPSLEDVFLRLIQEGTR
jgi:ABC-2 type transport system ATP-binding protein